MADNTNSAFFNLMIQRLEMSQSVVHGKMVEGGRLIIPARFRKEMGLAKGDAVIMEMHGDELRVRPAKSALKRLREKFRGSLPNDVSVVDELIAERRSESGNE